MAELRDLIPDEYRRKGRHVEAAWMEICIASWPQGVDREQFTVTRSVFFTGAAFMYDIIMKIADASNGKNASCEDVEFLNQLSRELGEFAQKALLENETAGHA